MAEDFDIIIVGSGAGGGTLAHTLAQTGKRILIVERGNFLPPEHAGPSTLDAPGTPGAPGAPGTPGGPGRDVSPETWYDVQGRPSQLAAHYFAGGATRLYGAALSRLRPMDFGRVAHMDGLSPAWPFSYAELEPWYSRAEWLFHVHGRHGEDPTEGAWSAQYLWPPVTHEPVIQRLADELTLAGYQPFHTPIAMLLDERGLPAGGCVRCETSGGVPWPPDARADADSIAVRPLVSMLNVTLLVNSEVTRLETDPPGRSVTGVVVKRADGHQVYRGHIVVLAAGAVNSAQILLRSASGAHPAGLANGSGQVGRNLMCHNRVDVAAAVAEPHHAVYPQTLGINDFYLGGRHGRWPLGSIQLLDWHVDAGRALAFRLTTEDLPRPVNRMTVDGQGQVVVAHMPTGDGAARLLLRNLRAMLRSTKVIASGTFERPAVLNAPRHGDYAGTCRFGGDPATCVLDADCKAHELDNLYVVDASFLPSIGAVSPALTVVANAIRVGEHLAARLGWVLPGRETAARGQFRSPAALSANARGLAVTEVIG